MTTAHKRRWFQFSLRTLFIVMTLFGCWLGYQLSWIRQRHALLSPQQVYGCGTVTVYQGGTSAPWSIRVFGEPGYGELIVEVDDCSDADDTKRRVEMLFPEAKVGFASHGM